MKNSIAANNTSRGLVGKIFSLQQFPYRGEIYFESGIENRFITYKNFLIFYEIQEDSKMVIINTVMHKKENRKLSG